jgi:hypothetical protein
MQMRVISKIVAARVPWRVSLAVIAAVVLALWSPIVDGQSDQRISRADEPLEAVVDAQGTLHVPWSYRADYEFLGAWAIAAADKGVGSKELSAGGIKAQLTEPRESMSAVDPVGRVPGAKEKP